MTLTTILTTIFIMNVISAFTVGYVILHAKMWDYDTTWKEAFEVIDEMGKTIDEIFKGK